MLKYKILFLALFCFVMLASCSHFTYYGQAIKGQWDIFKRTQLIEDLLPDPKVSISLKDQLSEILKIRTFAHQVLHLPNNASYTYYADLERPYAVWSVFAVPTFSLRLKQWCFLMIGCVSYRGYFSENSAQNLAEQLRSQGYDVYVAGIAAYSTLGWFSDPVLNTMLKWSEDQIAGLIFHELAHQQLYISDDTAFNEAFASTVEEIGVERWLQQSKSASEIEKYQQEKQKESDFIHLILTTRGHLQQLYQQQNLSSTQLQSAKTAIFETLQKQYLQLKKNWGGYTGYDAWFAEDLNNAKLLSIVTYQEYVPAFQNLLIQHDGNLRTFYQAATQLGNLPKEKRQAIIKKLLNS